MKDRPYPEHVPMEERPDFTPENVPDDVLGNAIGIAVSYSECPECGERQFHNFVPGHNSDHDCVECGFTMRIVG